MTNFAIATIAAILSVTPLPSWTFDNPDAVKAWVPNAHLANVAVRDGTLCGDAIDWDPMFVCEGLSFETTPWQEVVIMLRATKSGYCDLFWTGTTEEQYGGFSEAKKTRFHVNGDNAWHDVAVLPFWQTEGVVRKLRLDVYDDAHFEIRSIRVLPWDSALTPVSDITHWEAAGASWRRIAGTRDWFAPPLKLAVADKGWATVRLKARQDGVAAVLWSTSGEPGMKSETFVVRGGPGARTYNVELEGVRAWHDDVVALGVRVSEDGAASLESVVVAAEPSGPAELEVSYLGFENAVNRAGRPVSVIARVMNRGAAKTVSTTPKLVVSSGLRVLAGPVFEHRGLGFNEFLDATWTVQAEQAGRHGVTVKFSGRAASTPATATLSFLAARSVEKTDYVPPPHPVQTTVDIAAYYFPGWESPAKWDCIRRIAPVRKPLLGFYDEGNPECVDWQIKWAVENGIGTYLVDWYWIQGSQHLTHWFEAYRKARYRDQLRVAIMWANHNPPHTHSLEDWRNVTREWIDKYFTLSSYYRIDGKPAVFIWNPEGIRNDLGGVEAVRAALDESRRMAREAGYPGIAFAVVNGADSPGLITMLAQEGYSGATNYHEWGAVTDNAMGDARASFEEVARTAPTEWARRDALCKPLVYYPLVETGWDARPWHGEKSLVIRDRTPDRFECLLRAAKEFGEAHTKPLIVLGPVNEWGEGSYIEPCTDFDFEMLEAVRRAFAKGEPSTWPENIAPADVGRGPYDFPRASR